MSRNTKSLAAVILAALVAAGVVFAVNKADTSSARDEIVRVVESSYIHGAFNEQNTAAMREGFHPVFKIHGLREGKLSTYPIADWLSGIEKSKTEDGYEPETWEHDFPLIDITGDAAVVKVELLKVESGKKTHVYTDYLSLLKFENGWKITDKVYHRH